MILALLLALGVQRAVAFIKYEPVPLPEGWVDNHRQLLLRELSHHRFGFIVGSPRSGRNNLQRQKLIKSTNKMLH